MLQSDAKSDEQRVSGSPSPQPPPASQEMSALSPQAPAQHQEMAFEDAYFEISDITCEWASLADAIGVRCASDDDSDAVSEMLQLEHPDSSSPSVASSQGDLLALQAPAAIRHGDGAQSSQTRHGADVSPPDAGGNLASAIASTHVLPDGIGVAADIQADDIRTDPHSDAGVTSSSARRNNTPPHVMASNAPTRSTPPNTSCGPQQPVMHHNIPPSAPSPMFPGTDVSNRALPLVGPTSAHESPSAHFHPSSPLLSLHSSPPPPSLPPHPVPSTAPVSLSPQSGRTSLPRALSASPAPPLAHWPVERHIGDRHVHRTSTPSQDNLEVSATARPDFPGPARADLAAEGTVKAEPAPALTIAQLARRAPTPALRATTPSAPAFVHTTADAKLQQQQQQLLAARARSTPRRNTVPATMHLIRTGGSPDPPSSTPSSDMALSSLAGQDARAAISLLASSSPKPSPYCPPAPPANTTSRRAHAGPTRHPSPSSASELDAPASSELRPLSFDRMSEGAGPSTASAEDPRHSHVESNPVGDAARPHDALFAVSRAHHSNSTRASFAHRLTSAGLPQKPTWPFEMHATGVARPGERAVYPSECSDPNAGASGFALEATPADLAPRGAAFVPAPLPTAGSPGRSELFPPVDASIERRAVSGSSRDRPALSRASELAHEPSSTVATPSPAPDAPRAAAPGASADRLRSSSVARSRLDHSPANGKSHRDRAGCSSTRAPSMRSSYEPPPVAASSGVAVKAERRSCSPASSDCARSAHSQKPALIYRIRDPTPSTDEGSRSPSPPGAEIPLISRISVATPGPLIQRVGPRPETKKKKNKKCKRERSNEGQDVDGSEHSRSHAPKKQRW